MEADGAGAFNGAVSSPAGVVVGCVSTSTDVALWCLTGAAMLVVAEAEACGTLSVQSKAEVFFNPVSGAEE